MIDRMVMNLGDLWWIFVALFRGWRYVSRCHQHVPIIDPGLSMGVLGSDDNTYRVPIIDLREVAFASAPLKAGNT